MTWFPSLEELNSSLMKQSPPSLPGLYHMFLLFEPVSSVCRMEHMEKLWYVGLRGERRSQNARGYPACLDLRAGMRFNLHLKDKGCERFLPSRQGFFPSSLHRSSQADRLLERRQVWTDHTALKSLNVMLKQNPGLSPSSPQCHASTLSSTSSSLTCKEKNINKHTMILSASN